MLSTLHSTINSLTINRYLSMLNNNISSFIFIVIPKYPVYKTYLYIPKKK